MFVSRIGFNGKSMLTPVNNGSVHNQFGNYGLNKKNIGFNPNDSFVSSSSILQNQELIHSNGKAPGEFKLYKLNHSDISFAGANNSVKVSIIVPVYNTEKYLKKALNSLKNQTLKDIEVICINDGSTDNSLRILKKFAEKDNRFRVIDQKNHGTGATRNRGLKLAKGEYVGFIDPDDWLDPKACETLYKQAKIKDSDMVAFDYNTYNEKGKKLSEIKLSNTIGSAFDMKSKDNFTWKDIKPKEFFGLYYAAWNKIYKNSFLEKYHIKFTPCNLSEDNEFVIGATLNAKKISYCDKPFYNYLQRKGSAVHKFSNENLCTFDVYSAVKKVVEDSGFKNELKDEYNTYAIDSVLHQYHRVPPETRQKFVQMCTERLDSAHCQKVLQGIKDIDMAEKNIIKVDEPKPQKLLDNIFSIKNYQEFGIDKKVLTLFGIKIHLK